MIVLLSPLALTLIPSPTRAGEGGEPGALRAASFTWELLA
jgi:hypothetical protein